MMHELSLICMCLFDKKERKKRTFSFGTYLSPWRMSQVSWSRDTVSSVILEPK